MVEATGISSDDAFAGKPAVVPGTIQAEDFDWGGEGVGYSDSTPTNVRGVSGRGQLASNRTGVKCHAIRTTVAQFRGAQPFRWFGGRPR